MKHLPGIAALACTAIALCVFFVGHDTTTALMVGVLGLLLSGMSIPLGLGGNRTRRPGTHREDRVLRAQRRRLLTDVEAHRANLRRTQDGTGEGN